MGIQNKNTIPQVSNKESKVFTYEENFCNSHDDLPDGKCV